jgi:LmbE family N-acetylglucosaminyl deacetylase
MRVLQHLGIQQDFDETFPLGGPHFVIREAVPIIEREFRKFTPDLVAVPSVFDPHYDHIRLGLALRDAITSTGWQGAVLEYEVWNTLVPNVLLDISSVLAEKEAVMRLYSSQLVEPSRKYVERVLALNHHRGLTHKVDAAEGFILSDAGQYVRLLSAPLSRPPNNDVNR